MTAANAPLGILIFTFGGLAGAVFYLPFKKVRDWAWESYWLIYALAGLVIVPWLLALTMAPNTLAVLGAAPKNEILYCFLCGAAWGLGGLTWGSRHCSKAVMPSMRWFRRRPVRSRWQVH
jgi:L-rhamnose-H+ transport protein